MHVDHSWDVTGQGEQERVFPKKPTGFFIITNIFTLLYLYWYSLSCYSVQTSEASILNQFESIFFSKK